MGDPRTIELQHAPRGARIAIEIDVEAIWTRNGMTDVADNHHRYLAAPATTTVTLIHDPNTPAHGARVTDDENDQERP